MRLVHHLQAGFGGSRRQAPWASWQRVYLTFLQLTLFFLTQIDELPPADAPVFVNDLMSVRGLFLRSCHCRRPPRSRPGQRPRAPVNVMKPNAPFDFVY